MIGEWNNAGGRPAVTSANVLSFSPSIVLKPTTTKCIRLHRVHLEVQRISALSRKKTTQSLFRTNRTKRRIEKEIYLYKNKAYYWLSWMAQVEESGGLGRTNPVRSKLDIPSRWITFFLPNVAKLAVIISHSTGTETHITPQHYKSRIHFKMERNQNNNSKFDFIIVSYWRDLSWI